VTRAAAVFTLVLAVAAPATAQHFEVVPLTSLGYTPGVDLERHAPEIQSVKITGGLTWGGELGCFFSGGMGVELSWARQQTSLALETPSGRADLFDMSASQLRLNAVYQLGRDESRVRPFAFAGLGATLFSARDLEGQAKLSWGAGAGLKVFPWRRVGLRGQVTYKPTLLDAKSGACDPFDFCQDSLKQWDFTGGLGFRF